MFNLVTTCQKYSGTSDVLIAIAIDASDWDYYKP